MDCQQKQIMSCSALFQFAFVRMPDIVSFMHTFDISLLSDLDRVVCEDLGIACNETFTQLRDKTLQNQTFLPQCCVR